MSHINPLRLALTLGFLFSGIHLLWSIVVALGVGENFIYIMEWAHMVHTALIVEPFSFMATISVLVSSFIGGFFVGGAFALIWNRLNNS